MHCTGAGIGSIILSPVFFQPAGRIHARVRFIQGHFDERIGLVITQTNIVARSILFDQVAFQNQRFHLGRRHDGFKTDDSCHQRLGFGAEATLLEIGTNPVFQINGLTDINDLADLVPHQIHAGLIRQQSDLRRQFRFYVQRTVVFLAAIHDTALFLLIFRGFLTVEATDCTGNTVFRYCPVCDSATTASSSGVPEAMTLPPPSPPSGPRSIT